MFDNLYNIMLAFELPHLLDRIESQVIRRGDSLAVLGFWIGLNLQDLDLGIYQRSFICIWSLA